ncbi:hypothetical protein HYALB_00009449 [Hymenoscyphus albidus]|uniref:Uncharacterized protein n=1 Tax=Hymenoscyphus albidus TaxID=595503 RepID=A0A9N9LRP6_9HELO|nr:hypothetical protein HYALB_00009449 [Hymenoscyphus albidus]
MRVRRQPLPQPFSIQYSLLRHKGLLRKDRVRMAKVNGYLSDSTGICPTCNGGCPKSSSVGEAAWKSIPESSASVIRIKLQPKPVETRGFHAMAAVRRVTETTGSGASNNDRQHL